jgi:hypothetical protein
VVTALLGEHVEADQHLRARWLRRVLGEGAAPQHPSS